MRLSQEYQTVIKTTLLKHFGADSRFYLFGSRTDDTKRGGDIDLYIESNFEDAEKIMQARDKSVCELVLSLGDQKFDIVVHPKNAEMQLIHKIAARTGIEL